VIDPSALLTSHPHAAGGVILGAIFWCMVSASRCAVDASVDPHPVEVELADPVVGRTPASVVEPVLVEDPPPQAQEAIVELQMEVHELRTEMEQIVLEVKAQDEPQK
jgi:hypothetical protein